MLTVEVLNGLNVRTANFIVETVADYAQVQRIETIPMADGSGRWCSLVYLIDPNGEEATWRVATPAPADAPAWALAHRTYEVEEIQS